MFLLKNTEDTPGPINEVYLLRSVKQRRENHKTIRTDEDKSALTK